MIADPIATRYAQALFGTVKPEGQVAETADQLTFLGRLLNAHLALRQLFLNPHVDPDDKIGVLQRALQGTWSPTVQAFVRMVVSLGRPEHLPAIAEAFQGMVDDDQQRVRVIVRSAHPLSEAHLSRVRTYLERRERKQVEVATELATDLVGGLQIRLDHRVIDGSIQRYLDDLRERLTTVRVY